MKYIFLWIAFFLLAFESIQQETVIEIDFARNDRVKISQLVSDVRAIPLQSDKSMHVNKILKVILSQKYIFVSDQKVVNGDAVERVLQFDLEGKFIRQIGDTKQGGGLKFAINEEDDALFILAEGKTVKQYDYVGNYAVPRKTSPDEATIFDAIFYKGKFWKTRTRNTTLELIRVPSGTSAVSDKGHFISQNIVVTPEGLPAGSSVTLGNIPALSCTADDLYISYRMTDRIYKFDGSSVNPVYLFKFKGVRLSQTDRAPATNTFVAESFVHYEYSVNMSNRFILLYDMKANKSYHIRNEKNKSGIEDDVLNSGFVQITPLNKTGYVYFVKTADELQTKPELPKNGSNPVLFLARLKP